MKQLRISLSNQVEKRFKREVGQHKNFGIADAENGSAGFAFW